MKPSINRIETGDIQRIINIHKSCLPEDVFPNLGVQFLSKFYQRISEAENQILIGVYEGKSVLGFCHIAIEEFSVLSTLDLQSIFNIIKLAAFHPSIFISGIIQIFKKSPLDPDTAEIAFIAVDNDYQGQGLGKLLIESANDICRQKNKSYLQTKTSNKKLAQHYINSKKAIVVESYKIQKSYYKILKWKTGDNDV